MPWRAELRAALYAGIAIRDAHEEAGLSQRELRPASASRSRVARRKGAGRALRHRGLVDRAVGIVAFTAAGIFGPSHVAMARSITATPSPVLLAALANLPSPLRAAVLKTINAPSLEFSPYAFALGQDPGGGIYNAPDRVTTDPSYFHASWSKLSASGFTNEFTGYAVIGSTEYTVTRQWPSSALSVVNRSGDAVESFGLTAAQWTIFDGLVLYLSIASNVTKSSNGYTFQINHGVRAGSTGIIRVSDGYVEGVTLNLAAPNDMAKTTAHWTYGDFGHAPRVTVPS